MTLSYLCLRAVMAAGRMVAQMALLGVCLWGVFQVDTVWLNLLWLLLLSTVSALVVVRRAHLRMRLMWPVTTAGLFLGVTGVAACLLLSVFRPEQALSARWMIPVTGVLMAHAMPVAIRSLSTFFESLRVQSQPYLVQVGNGVSHWRALLPYCRQTLLAVVGPLIANLSVMGLFALPMLFSGMLLGGISPLQAALAVVALTLGSIVASVLVVALTLLLADRWVFDRRGNYQDVTLNDKK